MALPKGAELGASDDPRALIVGDKAAVAEQATAILDEQRRIGDLLDTIDGLAVPTWEGGLGKLGYVLKAGQETAKFEAYRDALKHAGTNLNGYADALAAAQDRAQDAIDKWNEGEAATKTALADHNAAVDGYNHKVDAHNAALRSGRSVPLIGFAHPGPFVDPGESLRKEAEEILADAREQLNDAGNIAVMPAGPDKDSKTVGDGEAKATNWGGLGALGSILGGFFDTNADNPAANGGKSGELKGFKISPDGKAIQLIDANGETHQFQIDGNVGAQAGDVKLEADGSLTLNSHSGEAIGKIDKDGLHLSVGVHERIVDVEGNLSIKDGYLTMGANGYAYVGSDAEANLKVGRDGVEAGVDVSNGAKAGLGGSINYGGIGIGLNAEGQTGSGATGSVDYGWKDGKFNFGSEFGLTPGIGGTIKPSVELDFPEMGRTAKEIIEDPDVAARDLANTANDINGAVGHGIRWAAEHPGESAEGAAKGALALPKTYYEIGKLAMANPEEAADIADGMTTNPVEQYNNIKRAIGPDAVDKISIDAGEAKNAAKGVVDAIGGFF
ncbi:putative T7SS-secreted protein [Nocardioides sp. NPDC058538]|uniref:putative T7SS-secreted protein n=1 Tax=Nocardioides sp. NPDC058538 TaxID=3346542 RepID=UPI0036601E9E